MSKEAMKLALEALEAITDDVDGTGLNTKPSFDASLDAITALREALAEQPAQPQQEPVATWVGKWFVGTTQKEPRVYLEQDGFDSHDVRLYVNGNFENVQQCIAYAERLARNMNGEDQLKENAEQPAQQEPVEWISVKDALPKAVQGVSYNAGLTDVVLVRHSDRPDYPITAHAVVGEGLGAGIAIPTEGASEHPEIAWYSASSNLNNPFNLKDDDYERYLPKIFGSKITHWKPLYTSPPQRTWVGLTDEEIYSVLENLQVMHHRPPTTDSRVIFARAIEAKIKEKNQ